MHLAIQRDYPKAEILPIPPNLDVTETARFSPLRNRDLTSSAMSVHHKTIGIDVTLEQSKPEVQAEIKFDDPHLGSYDRTTVNLGAVMQSTVPEPYGGNHKFSHLNMPGGNWSQQTKYLSYELNSNHYTQLRQDIRSDWSQYKGSRSPCVPYLACSLLNSNRLIHHQSHFLIINKRFISLSAQNFNEHAQKPPGESDSKTEQQPVKESAKEKLKKAVKEYGSTVIVFHVGISLMSLGMFYALVSR